MVARRVACALFCAIGLFFLGGCATPVGVEQVGARTAYRDLNANVVRSDALSQSTRNVLRRWVLSERYDSDPEGAILALHAIVVDGRGDEDELISLSEMAFLHAEDARKRSYYLAAAVYSYAFLFSKKRRGPPSPYDPGFRLAADLYNRGISAAFASADGATVEIKGGSYELPFGTLDVAFDPSQLEWNNRRIVALYSVQDVRVRGLINRYRVAGIGAPLAADTQPIVAERGMQVEPHAKLPVTALLRLDAPREQLAQKDLHAELDLYNAYDLSTVAVAGQPVPLETDETATLAYSLSEPELWNRELAAFFSGILSESAPTQLASIDSYRPGRMPVIFVHGTASSAGRWADMANDLLADPRIRDRFQIWFFTYDTGNPVLYSAALLRESIRDAVHKLDPTGADPALREMVVIGHSQGGLLAKALVVDSGDRLWNAIANKPFDTIVLSAAQRDLFRRTLFIEPLPNVHSVIFIATPHRGSYLAEFSIAGVLRYFLTLPLHIAEAGYDLTTRNAGDFKIDPREIGAGSLFGMSPRNPIIQTMATIPVAPGVHAYSIIAVAGSGPIEDSGDGVVKYKSSHLQGVDSEYIVHSGHSTQSNPYTIEEVRRILLRHAADACARIACGEETAPPGKPLTMISR